MERFSECKSDAAVEEFLMHDPLGLYALSVETLLDAESEGFSQEYEFFDVRGDSLFRGDIINVTVGESRGGAGLQQAVLQLVKRLTILRYAMQHLLTEEQWKRFRVSLQGIVFTTDSQWVSPTDNNIAGIPEEGLSIVVHCTST